MIRKLNEEAKCLEKLVVVVLDRAGNVPWKFKEERLGQLREVKSGVRIGVGKELMVHGVRYERNVEAERYIEEMNAERGWGRSRG